MWSVSRDADRKRLEREILDDEYQELLVGLGKEHPFLRGFADWGDVVAFMRSGPSRDPAKDAVLLPILRAHARDRDPRWRTILLVIFWPALESILRQKRHWDTDPDELWANIVWIFLQVVCRLDPSRRASRLSQKLFNDTVHRLHDEYRRAWSRAKREFAATPDEVDAIAGGIEWTGFAGIDLRDAQEHAIARLRQHADAGRISEADYLLLAGTRVYGRSVTDYAREAGLDYQVAKKRRQRAEAAIRRFEAEQR